MKRWLTLGIKETLSRERFADSLKNLGKLRLNISHGRIIALSALILILFVAFTIRILPLRWEIPQGSVRLNEFDPYYQYILTRYMVQNGLLAPYYPEPWVFHQLWYPQGLDMSRSLPGLPMLAASLYSAISFLGVNIDLMGFASLLPAIIGTLTCFILYFVGKDMGGKPVGLLAALFLALSPGYIQRTSLGFFDTEVPGIFSLVLFIFLFLRANDENRTLRSSLLYTAGSALTLAFFVLSWGAAYYITGLVALFAFVLIVLKRYSPRMLITYSITFGVALFLATKWPEIGLGYLTSGPVIPVAGVFLLLCLAEVLRNNISARTKVLLTVGAVAVIVGGFAVVWQLGYMEAIAGKFITVLDPFLRSANPLINSVAEHRISTWSNIYIDLGIGLVFFITGMYFTLRNPTNKNVFLLLFGLTALYFAASMVRLLAVFAPAFSLLAAAGIVGILKPFYTLLREAPRIVVKTKRGLARVSKEYSGVAIFLVFILVVTDLAITPQNSGVPRVYGVAYAPIAISASSLPLGGQSLTQPVEEWSQLLQWTQTHLNSSTVVCAWWDYGYWLGILGNVTTLADNATINATQIENVGFIMMANETQSLKLLKQYNAEYVLVFVTLYIYSSGGQYIADFGQWGDEAKWTWMAKISGEAKTRFLAEGLMNNQTQWSNETTFGTASQSGWQWNDVGTNSTIYKLMSYAKDRWGEVSGNTASPAVSTNFGGIQPTYFTEAYFAGENTNPYAYGGILPLVALYKIDWAKYNSDFNITG